jgi:hypothetical protein
MGPIDPETWDPAGQQSAYLLIGGYLFGVSGIWNPSDLSSNLFLDPYRFYFYYLHVSGDEWLDSCLFLGFLVFPLLLFFLSYSGYWWVTGRETGLGLGSGFWGSPLGTVFGALQGLGVQKMIF